MLIQQNYKGIARILLVLVLCKDRTCTKQLRLLGLLSETGLGYRSAGSCLPAIDMALEDISNHRGILKDYNLTFTWVDSKCHAGTALFRMFERLQYDRPYHMLLGPSCSIAAQVTAQVSFMWNLTQLSCQATSPILSDRKRFPRFFRTAMPDSLLNIPKIAMFDEFNWRKVATVHQADDLYFSSITDDFIQRIQHTNITIISQTTFADDPFDVVNNFKKQDARIILTAMYEDKASELICAAYKEGFYGSNIVWMFLGWYSSSFWKKHSKIIDCTEDQMAAVVEGAFLADTLPKNPFEERGIANITVSEFEKRFYSHQAYNEQWKSSEDVAASCYDYIWTAALALECTDQTLRENGHHKTLDEFTYADGDIGEIIFDCMGNVSMVGVSGKTTFEDGPDAEKIVRIDRVQDGKREKVGFYRQDKDPSYFEWIEGGIRWEDGVIPTDSAKIINEEIKIPLSLYVVMITLGTLGICLSLCFLGINVIYRNNRNIKLSSPNINNMLLLGCILCYLTVFFRTTGMENVTICRARVYCFSLGFTLTFGSLFSKTWRVYRIFINKTLSKVQIKDSQLFVVICFMVMFILSLLVTWDIVGPPMVKYKYLKKKEYKTSDGNIIRPFVQICSSEYSVYFSWALYITQGALLTFGTFLAWETRHVRVKVLNDSQKIGISLYNVVILTGVGVMLSFLLENQEVLLYGITSGFLIFGTTVTLMLIFIPKVRALVNKVEIGSVSTIAGSTQRSTRRQTTKGELLKKGDGPRQQPQENLSVVSSNPDNEVNG